MFLYSNLQGQWCVYQECWQRKRLYRKQCTVKFICVYVLASYRDLAIRRAIVHVWKGLCGALSLLIGTLLLTWLVVLPQCLEWKLPQWVSGAQCLDKVLGLHLKCATNLF